MTQRPHSIRTLLRMPAAVLLLFLVAMALRIYFSDDCEGPWEAVVQAVKDNVRPGDIALVGDPGTIQCLNRFGDGKVVWQDASAIDLSTLKKAGRVWLVGAFSTPALPGRLEEKGLEIASPLQRTPLSDPDERLLRLFILDPQTALAHLPDSIVFSDADFAYPPGVVRGVYPGEGPMRWTARNATFRMRANQGERICFQGHAPSMLYRKSSVEATISVLPAWPAESSEAGPLAEQIMTLMGTFWFCLDALPDNGPVRIVLDCHDSFIPDDLFADGDLEEKCLELRRVWTEQAVEDQSNAIR